MTDSTPRATTEAPHVRSADQPFHYPLKRQFVEPDWRRIPGYKNVTQEIGRAHV